MTVAACPICGGVVFDDVGIVAGTVNPREYRLRRCRSCQFVFVSNPWLEYGLIYSEDYYNGRGADTKLNYVEEVQHPTRTVRRYEWRGVLNRIRTLTPVTQQTKWLDYGCGTGGLVEYLRSQAVDAVGFEQGWCVELLKRNGTPTIDEADFERNGGRFDIVSGIEVIEHTPDPVAVLRSIRRLLKPGGLLFMTTGNAEPFHDRFTSWRYVTPEVHISYFEPSTLARALEAAEFKPIFPGYGPGWEDIIRYKLLMTLRRKWSSPPEAIVPWGLLARLVDSHLKLSAQPVGWALS
ncbi:MAG TPA: class I SAM-dependent methyltransferase [Acidimicrobiales bacterium]|nr:class I SAM-dependent methyltransferase [Acidimicrobiales bacterium]